MLFCFVVPFVFFSLPFEDVVFLYTRIRLEDQTPPFLVHNAEEGFILDDADLLCFGDLRSYARFSVGIPMHVRHLGNSKSGKCL